MKKIFNFRYFFLVALSMIVSVVFATYVFTMQKIKLVLSLSLIVCGIILLIFAFVFKRKFIIVLSTLFIFVSLPFINNYLYSIKLNQNKDYFAENNVILGKIYNFSKYEDGNVYSISLDNIKTESGNKLTGNAVVYISATNIESQLIQIGNVIKVRCSQINSYSLDGGDLDYSMRFLSRGVTVSCFSGYYGIEKLGVEKNLRDNIKSFVLSKLENFDSKYAGLGYAMLFGDDLILDETTESVFRDAGIAHLLAVSGFHVSIIVLIISFIFDKLRLKRYLKFIFIGLFLIFYAYLCNFSVSVIRATIMSIVLLLASFRNKEYDTLSSLSVACLIILLIYPLNMFNVSFVLSFSAVFSIICLMPVINRFLEKFISDKIASSLSLVLSVQVGLTITQLYYFGKVPILSVLSNLVCVPIVSVMFIFYFFWIILSLIIPIFFKLIVVYDMVINIVLQFSYWVATVTPIIYAEYIRIFVFVLDYFLVFSLSDYYLVKNKTKLITAITIAGVIGLAFII